MKNLAILVDKLGFTQKSQILCEELNKISEDINITVFCAEYAPVPIKTNFPVMELIKCYDFKGIFIATDFYTVQVMNHCLFPQKKFFYVWDLEYLYHPLPFEALNNIYNNKDIHLLARNQDRYNILESTWKKPFDILNEFDHKKLESLL